MGTYLWWSTHVLMRRYQEYPMPYSSFGTSPARTARSQPHKIVYMFAVAYLVHVLIHFIFKVAFSMYLQDQKRQKAAKAVLTIQSSARLGRIKMNDPRRKSASSEVQDLPCYWPSILPSPKRLWAYQNASRKCVGGMFGYRHGRPWDQGRLQVKDGA